MSKIKLPSYTLSEELINSISHGIGACLSVAALVLCVIKSALYGDAYAVVSSAIYGSTLVILYCMSTLYHSLTNKTARRVFRVFDHVSIYLLIAGSYTPFTLVTLNGALGWTLFGITWGVSILGIVLNAVNIEKFTVFSMISYICIGWSAVIGLKPIAQALWGTGLILLVLGGLLYTIGIIFFELHKFKYMHSIWHLFVLAGSILHFFCIYFYVLPTK